MKYYRPTILFLCVLLGLHQRGHSQDFARDPNSLDALSRQIEALPSDKVANLTFKSSIDGTFQPMLIKMPRNYAKTKPWPLLVVLHGLGDGPIIVPSIDSMVQIGPFGRGDLWYSGPGEKDVFECIEMAKKVCNIDPDRIYLCGFSMGATGTFSLGLKYPHIWAGCVPVCGSMDSLDMVANGKNLPFWINIGREDRVVLPKYAQRPYDKAIELGFDHWKFTPYPNMGHSFWIDWGEIEKWLLKQKRVSHPSQISFTGDKPARAYWAEINEKLSSGENARIDVTIMSQDVLVRTSNVARYTLYLEDAPIDIHKNITIIENNKESLQCSLAKDGAFHRKLNTGTVD